MIQFLADNIDQMDLALDQLAVRDRNFDRFALMLIDNVVELTLHKHALDKGTENKMLRTIEKPRNDPKVVASALGQQFESKVKLARMTGMLSQEVAETVLYLHSFRNTVYHKGMRHEGILHSLALFYFKNACLTLAAYSPLWWSSSSRDQISHRAMKYLGKPGILNGRELMKAACDRLSEVGESMGDALIPDLHSDMEKTIDAVDEQIKFLTDNSPTHCSRKEVVIDAQAWPLAFTDEGKAFFVKHKRPEHSVAGIVEWLGANYALQVKSDPIPSWRSRLVSIAKEKDAHIALKKYCDFIKQTEDIRGKIDESAAQLDAHIQSEIDRIQEERSLEGASEPTGESK